MWSCALILRPWLPRPENESLWSESPQVSTQQGMSLSTHSSVNYTPLPRNPSHYCLTDLLQSIPTTHSNPRLAITKAECSPVFAI